MGSGLEDQLTRARTPLVCPSNRDWERIWIEPKRILRMQCFESELLQTYNTTTKTFHNTQGVEVRAIDFGGVHGVDYIAYNDEGSPINATAYFASLIANLEGAGYQVGTNLAAAPYDWRRTDNPSGWNDQFKALVEQMYSANDNAAVFVLCHSMGNLEFASFMSTMDQAWKDQYIAGFISAAAPWSGASKALRSIVSGTEINVGPIHIDGQTTANLARTFGSVVWMTPTRLMMGEKPIVVTNTTSYNYNQLEALYTEIGATVTLDIYKDSQPLDSIPAPGVPTYCLYGTDVATELSYEYMNGLDQQPTTIHYEQGGDGTVPLQSLLKCLEMKPVASREFDLLGHSDLVRDPAFFEEVMKIVSGEI